MNILLAIFALESALDGWTTFQIIRFGGKELIPYLAWLIKKIGKYPALIIAKGIPIAAIAYLYYYGWNGTKLDFSTMAWIDAGYALVIINNYRAFTKHKGTPQ